MVIISRWVDTEHLKWFQTKTGIRDIDEVKELEELPARKGIRLKGYDYSSAGCYFITICAKDRHEMLGTVVGDAPLCVPSVQLSEYGVFVEAQIQKVDQIYPCISVDKYVIMPNHIHMLAIVEDGTHGNTSPTKAMIPRIVQSLKSMTTKQFGFSMWQRSYHDHVIRDESEYQRIWEYIDNNPALWREDVYFTKG